jgi:hypothetical protein
VSITSYLEALKEVLADLDWFGFDEEPLATAESERDTLKPPMIDPDWLADLEMYGSEEELLAGALAESDRDELEPSTMEPDWLIAVDGYGFEEADGAGWEGWSEDDEAGFDEYDGPEEAGTLEDTGSNEAGFEDEAGSDEDTAAGRLEDEDGAAEERGVVTVTEPQSTSYAEVWYTPGPIAFDEVTGMSEHSELDHVVYVVVVVAAEEARIDRERISAPAKVGMVLERMRRALKEDPRNETILVDGKEGRDARQIYCLEEGSENAWNNWWYASLEYSSRACYTSIEPCVNALVWSTQRNPPAVERQWTALQDCEGVVVLLSLWWSGYRTEIANCLATSPSVSLHQLTVRMRNTKT